MNIFKVKFWVLTIVLISMTTFLMAEMKEKRSFKMDQMKTETIVLPALPFVENGLEPVISARTLGFHYGKHHQGYVNKLKDLLAGSELEGVPLEEIMARTSGHADKASIFNNAGQIWNHTFYWHSLSPTGGGEPSGEIGKKIDAVFGSYKQFVAQFIETGLGQFGSGWVWLVKDGDLLKIIKTANADNPISLKMGKPLLVIDVWEHAYYLDYQNRRNDYLKTVLEKLINWKFAEKNLRMVHSD